MKFTLSGTKYQPFFRHRFLDTTVESLFFIQGRVLECLEVSSNIMKPRSREIMLLLLNDNKPTETFINIKI